MGKDFSFINWQERLRICKDFASEEKCDEYLSLLAVAENNLCGEVVIELIKTFSDFDDFGIQERTRNILEGAGRSIFYPALVHELSDLIARAPEKLWAVTLVGIELEYGDFSMLLDCALKSSKNDKDVFLSFIKSKEFLAEYPDVLKHLH